MFCSTLFAGKKMMGYSWILPLNVAWWGYLVISHNIEVLVSQEEIAFSVGSACLESDFYRNGRTLFLH
jgi:hypothetical protein